MWFLRKKKLDLINFLQAREADREAAAQADLADPSSLHARRKRAEWTLADVASKRHLLAGHGPGSWVDESDGRREDEPDNWDPPWQKCTYHDWVEYPCEMLRLLALPYANHSDYRESWRL